MFTWLIHVVAPILIVTSPITSYADQIRSIHLSKSSRGFSLDTPLIMLVASILRCFYWVEARYEVSLLLQSLITILVQVVLLKVALDHRPPFNSHPATPISYAPPPRPRPYHFWQWRPQKPYWNFLGLFTLLTLLCQLFLGQSTIYNALLGLLALGIEATLPIPQVLQNWRNKSCNGFRLSVMVSWVLGDVMKQVYFFSAEHVNLQFKLCALVQMSMDLVLAWQFWTYGNGDQAALDTGMGMGGVTVAEKLEMGRF